MSAFQPPDSLAFRVGALLAHADVVVVVDDGSPAAYSSILNACRAAGASVVSQTSNSGIAAALNVGIAELRKNASVDFILTMDQDSDLSEDYVTSMVELADRARAAGVHVGMIAPGRVHGTMVRTTRHTGLFEFGGEPIQSGLMIPVDALEKLGPFAECLFIDLVDSEFFLRAISRGYSCLVCRGAELNHQLGSLTRANLFGAPLTIGGKSLRVRTAATWRYYYIVRNRVLVVRAHGARHLWWSVKGILSDLRHLAIVTTLASGRRGRLRNARAGLADGLRGVRGKRQSTS